MIEYPKNVNRIHIELTDKCQAACPMCSRNQFGGAESSHIKNIEITLDQFKEWFPKEFLSQIEYFYACGNDGDPVIAKDCLEIFEYVAKYTPDNAGLAIHTNGSLRTKEWWKDLAAVLGQKGKVIFAIDGFAGEHEIYRRNTDWNKIIQNAQAFIEAGGTARADCLIFKHNEDRIEELKEFLLNLGFSDVILKPTQRFHGMPKFPVKDKDGNIEYYIEGPTKKKYAENVYNPDLIKLVQKENYQRLLNESIIEPKCVNGKEIFVTCRGSVWPCCFVQQLNRFEGMPPEEPIYIIRERLRLSGVEVADNIGIPNLHGTNIINVLQNISWQSTLEKHYTTEKKLVCVKSCSTNFRQLVENVENKIITYW